MNKKQFYYAGVLALFLLITFIASWELWWRSNGYAATFNDDKALWAKKRAEVYESTEKSTVFIGSSRIKFDLDIPTWKEQSGEKAIQLSLVGTSPRKLLQDLADDEKFKGKLVVDITEVLFFSLNPRFHESAIEAINFYKKQTPSEWLSANINFALESKLVFLEEKRFALNTLLEEVELPNRPGVFAFPAFPKSFEWTTADRQTYMSDMFLSDTTQINRQTGIWTKLIMANRTPPVSGPPLIEIFNEIKTAADKIKNRGGNVVFVRTPSSGPMAIGESKAYPREKYWDALINYTNIPGIHYMDFPETANFICPEWSHLSPTDAKSYTVHLVNTLREQGWFSSPTTKL